MPRVPGLGGHRPFVPTVDPQVGGMVPLQAQQTRPMQNFAPQQMQEAGRLVHELGGLVIDHAMKAQDEVDSANIKRHDNILADEIESIMRDPKSGYLNQVGKVAVDNRQVAFDALAKKQKDIEKGLQNPLQRQIWGENAQKRIRQATSDANEHYTKQTKVWEIGESQVRGSNFVRDMERNATRTDPEGVAAYSVAKKGLLGEADRIAELSGHPIGSAQYNETRLQSTTNAHSTIIRGMADQNPQKAQEHLDAASTAGEIAPEVAADLKKLVQGATENDQAQRLASSPEIAGKSLQEKVDHIQSLYAAKDGIPIGVRDNAVSRILDEHRINNIGKAEQQAAMQGEWQKWLMDNKNLTPERAPAELKKWATETGSWDWINGFARNGRIVTNPEVFSMVTRAAEEDPVAFASGSDAVFETTLSTQLDPQDMAYVRALRNRAKGSMTEEDRGIFDRDEVINNAARRLGYIKGTSIGQEDGDDNRVKYDNLRSKVNNAVVRLESKERRKALVQEIQKITDTIETDFVFNDGDPVRLIDIGNADPNEISVTVDKKPIFMARIPPEEVDRATRALQKRGMMVTSQNIAEFYSARGMPGYQAQGSSTSSFPLAPDQVQRPGEMNKDIQKAIMDAYVDDVFFGVYR